MSESKNPCRLCAKSSNPDTDNVFSNEDQTLIQLIQKLLSITITTSDVLPSNVCELCRFKLITFDEYAQKCAITQIQLISTVEKIAIDELESLVKSEYNRNLQDCIKLENVDIKSENEGHSHDDDNFNLSEDSYKNTPKKRKKKIKSKSSKKTLLKKKRKYAESVISEIQSDINDQISEIKIESVSDNELSSLKIKSVSFAINNSIINFFCHICPETFKTWASLNFHTKHVHSSRPKILCLCGKYLRNKKGVYAHILKHDKAVGFKCEICNKSFMTEKYYKLHLSRHSSDEQISFKCEQCNKEFTNATLLKLHVEHHNPIEERLIHPCDICGTKFSSKYSVKQHIINIHKKEKSHMCDVCGMAFPFKGALKAHSSKHSSERPHSCPYCPKSFKTKPPFKRHLDCHNGVQYKCDKCPSSFNYQRTLQEHMFVHQDICRFICNICDKGFKWKRSFQTHMNIHTGDTPYSCPWCPKTFADGPNCRIHKRRNHPIELAEYEASLGSQSGKYARPAKLGKSLKKCKKNINPSGPNSGEVSETE